MHIDQCTFRALRKKDPLLDSPTNTHPSLASAGLGAMNDAPMTVAVAIAKSFMVWSCVEVIPLRHLRYRGKGNTRHQLFWVMQHPHNPPNGLTSYSSLPPHQSVSSFFNQQRHHPIRLDFTSHIPPKLFNAECQPSSNRSLSCQLRRHDSSLNNVPVD